VTKGLRGDGEYQKNTKTTTATPKILNYSPFIISFGAMWYAVEVKVKAKVKLSLCLTKHHAMKTYWGSGDITPLAL
jgi:hypothetical protein